MSWEELVKVFDPNRGGKKPDPKTPEKKPKEFKGFKRRTAKDTMEDFNIADFPKDACSSWQPFGRGCQKKATWACAECGAQWCDEHKDSGMDGHNNMVKL